MTYYAAKGLAFQKGLEQFGKMMPKKRFYSLKRGYEATKGRECTELNFIHWVICVAGREEKGTQQRLIRPNPEDPTNPGRPFCKKKCQYRQSYNGYSLQKNALRSELASMIQSERCGWNLKLNHIGGHPLDYAPCIYRS